MPFDDDDDTELLHADTCIFCVVVGPPAMPVMVKKTGGVFLLRYFWWRVGGTSKLAHQHPHV